MSKLAVAFILVSLLAIALAGSAGAVTHSVQCTDIEIRTGCA